MAKCYNRNTSEYQVLLNRFDSPMLVDGIIDSWQSVTKSNIIPTLFDVEQFVEDQRVFNSLQKKDLAESILDNLGPKSEKKLISKFNGDWFINNTAKGAIQGDSFTLENNRKKLERILDFWQINSDAVSIEKTDKSYRIKIIGERLAVTDSILESNDITHANDIIAHLGRLFPDVNIKVLNEEAAKKVYDSLPQFKEIDGRQFQKKPDFNNVKSFYANGNAVLIQGRVTSETAIEEVLHPFISSLAADKSTLFNSLVKESRNSFPMLYQTIQATYSDTAGFIKEDRDMELVTQALSRHFKKEYEEVPTVSFRSKIKDFMKWMMEIFRDLSKWVVGSDLVIYPGMLNDTNTLTDLAKMLNTNELQFKVDRSIREDRQVRFKLSKKKKAIYDKYGKKGKGGARTTKQQNKVKDFYNGAITSKKAMSDSTVSMSGKKNHPLTIYNKSNNTFENVETQTQVPSIASKIDPSLEKNLKLKNDFNSIIEDIILEQAINYKDLKLINKKTADRFYTDMKKTLSRMTRNTDTIILPQVVVSDKMSNVAGLIDLLFIDADGRFQIINLEITDYEVDQDSSTNPYNGGKNGKDLITVKKDSILYDKEGSKYNRKSKKQLDSLQANALSRIIGTNQGNEIISSSTLYVYAPMKNNKYSQFFSIGNEVLHETDGMQSDFVFVGNPTNNNLALSKIVQYNPDATALDKSLKLDKETGDTYPDEDVSEAEAIAGKVTSGVQSKEAKKSMLVDHTKALTKRKDAIERLKNDAILFKSGKQMSTEIDRTISVIELGLLDDNVDAVFVEILQRSTKDLEDFILYVNDPNNYMNDKQYIGKVLNFNKMIKTYEGLAQFEGAEEITGTASKLMKKLSSLILKIQGTRDGVGSVKKGEEGLINDAIDNFAKQFIKSNSSREFTEQDLTDILLLGKDIGDVEYYTGTMATSSDTILALMDKIFKRKRQEVLDKIQERNETIRELTLELEKASNGKINYDFMLVMEDGLPTGRYVQKIGKIFYEEQRKAAEDLKNEEGDSKEYHIGSKLTQKQKQENIELHAAKKKFGAFMKAEKYIDGAMQDGNFYKFTDQFKTERSKFEYFDGYNWNKKDNVPTDAWLEYRNKYYKPSLFNEPIYSGDQFTGEFKTTPIQGWFVKDKYREKNSEALIGGRRINLLDEKWEKLQDPKTQLEKAQKNFYDMYIKYFEEDLLNKLPMRIVQQMHGKIPLIKDTTYNSITKGPNIITRLWAKAKAAPGSLKDYFFTRKHTTKIVLTDESGAFVDTLPMFYVGSPRSEEALRSLTDKINAKEQELQTPKTETEIKRITEEIEKLKGRRLKIQAKPERQELSTDLSDSLIRFSGMAENYEVMSSIEDTLGALLKVLQKRGYKPDDGSDLKTYEGDKLVDASIKPDSSLETVNVLRRAQKWMKMVYYDNDKKTEGVIDKISKNLISYTSLTYVGLNPWGNLNNYIIGRLNNTIETAGGRWYERGAGVRAIKEFNNRALPDFFKKMGGKTMINDMLGVSPSEYELKKAASKWEALVNLYRMMDQKSDIRELNKEYGQKESGIQRVWGWGYMLQDAAEYNVQTKVGMSILMSTKVYKSSDVDGNQTAISLYDAYDYDQDTGKLTIKEGYDTMIDYQTGKHNKISDKARYDLRQYIREVNIHIHGNYAYEDRMVMQTSALGQLAAQFHKWIAPAIKARYRGEYYDENLGWIQGRYLTFWSFMLHVGKDMMNARQASKEWKKLKGDPGISKEELNRKIQIKEASLAKTTSPDKQHEIQKEITDLKIMGEGKDKAERYVKNIYRTSAEIGLVLTTIMVKHLFTELWDDEGEDEEGNIKRFQNAFMYQLDRQQAELLQFVSMKDALRVIESPLSSTRMIKEMGEALMSAVQTPVVVGYDRLVPNQTDIKLDKRVYYQRGNKKGDLKLWKETRDAMPLLYALNRWWSYDQIKNYWVK